MTYLLEEAYGETPEGRREAVCYDPPLRPEADAQNGIPYSRLTKTTHPQISVADPKSRSVGVATPKQDRCCLLSTLHKLRFHIFIKI